MLEALNPKVKIDKAAYKNWFPRLKTELRELEQSAREAGIPVMVMFEGFRMSGKADAIMTLSDALDPRGFTVHSRTRPSYDEELRHWLWRFWIRVPSRGKFSLFEQTWYSDVLFKRANGMMKVSEASRIYQEINQTEEMLAADGALIIKFWHHLSKKGQKKRLKAAEKDPMSRFPVRKADWEDYENYKKNMIAAEEMLERTSTHVAPWVIVEAEDNRYRRMKILQTLCEVVADTINQRKREQVAATAEKKPATVPDPIVVPVLEEMPTVLDKVDLSKSLDDEEYDREKVSLQVKLRRLQYKAIDKDIPTVIIFQGWDAAGKGGTIRRLTATLDPRHYDVVAISKPSDIELAHHYLWRFWRQLPKKGDITIFDRSWYGRVLVERIEGFCSEDEWRRAYQEINEFENMLSLGGTTIIKFWLHISQEEQLARFKARQEDPNKSWKIGDEDWRNREKWDQYREAVDEMITRTSTTFAPWHVVPANCKRHARIECMKHVTDALEEAVSKAKKKKK